MAEPETGVRVLDVAEDEGGVRLDRWFRRRFPSLGHGRLEKLLRTGQVRIDGKRAKAGARLEAGQKVRVPPLADAGASPRRGGGPKPVPAAAAKALVATVLHRDSDVLVIDKPAGLAVQGGSRTGLNVDAMLDALRFGSAHRPRLVHRLDKDTSGVLLLARNPTAAAALASAFRSKAARKLYWAVTVGVPSPAQGIIRLRLGKVAGQRGERVVADAEEGKRAETVYRVLDRAGKRAAWLALAPLTGRTHQLRVHLAAIHTPIVGDGKYGGRDAFLDFDGVAGRLHLHARAIRLPHPRGGELAVTAPPPTHFAATLSALGLESEISDDDLAM